MKWYVPSWSGDFRLDDEPCDDLEDAACRLVVEKPTPAERALLRKFLNKAMSEKWVLKKHGRMFVKRMDDATDEMQEVSLLLEAPISEVGPHLVGFCKPKDRTITAVKFKDGKLDVCELYDSKALAKTVDEGERAASVSRPTISCPDCIPGSVAPAREVLLDFLTPAEHDDWAKHRAIVVTGGISGYRYLLMHRHSENARKLKRICFDLDHETIVHFHDWSVPPEEEVLAAKLILEHREPWLRNEASLYHAPFVPKFKNPFGDVMDGTWDAGLATGIGFDVKMLLEIAKQRSLQPRP